MVTFSPSFGNRTGTICQEDKIQARFMAGNVQAHSLGMEGAAVLEVIDDGTKSEVEVRVHFAEADAAGE